MACLHPANKQDQNNNILFLLAINLLTAAGTLILKHICITQSAVSEGLLES